MGRRWVLVALAALLLAAAALGTVQAAHHVRANRVAAGLCWYVSHPEYVGCRAWAVDSLLVGMAPAELAGVLEEMAAEVGEQRPAIGGDVVEL